MPNPRGRKIIKKKSTKPRIFRKKYCRLCRERIEDVDYKDVNRLQRFISDRGKIIATRISGNCAKHQRKVASAIKRARFMALLPFLAD